MNDYTAEDFANARFAANLDGRRAIRMDGGHWRDSNAELYTHPALIKEVGWRPVVEAGDLMRRTIIGKNDLIDTLSQRIRELEGKRDSAPLSLDTLREAWENAEVPTGVTPIRDGDTAITQVGEDDFAVYRSCTGVLTSAVRILHRAPQPEPWQALADEMEELYDGYSLRAAEAAQFLHERGVRVVGGDES